MQLPMPASHSPKRWITSILVAITTVAAAVYWWPPPPLPSFQGVDFGLDGTAASVFAPDKLLAFEFEVRAEDLQNMRDHAREELAVPARLRVGTQSVGMVGLRYKGSTGTLNSVLDERQTESYMPKLSMKIEFDKFEAKKRFCQLRRLNFHSMIYDGSLMRDRLCYQAFREAGVIAPRCSHAMIIINGEYSGVFAMVEQIDKVFVQDRFEETANGILYKEVWPTRNDQRPYLKEQRWNPGNRPHKVMMEFARDLSTATDDELPAVVAKRTDLDALLRYFIIDEALKNWDGVRGWTSKTADGAPWNHNYYWFLSPQDQLTLIPWDLDSTLKHPGPRDNLRPWHDLSDIETTGHATNNQWFAWAPNHDPLIRAVALHARGRYQKVASELLNGPLNLDHQLQSIATWHDQIRATVAHDPHLGSLWRWERQLDDLRTNLQAIQAH
ncbi:MAG: hypothetical protein ACI9SE_001750 [Neolewinella sp.]|jgi:hypothetical protein